MRTFSRLGSRPAARTACRMEGKRRRNSLRVMPQCVSRSETLGRRPSCWAVVRMASTTCALDTVGAPEMRRASPAGGPVKLDFQEKPLTTKDTKEHKVNQHGKHR